VTIWRKKIATRAIGWAARRLLSESRLPVKRIAQRCGFGSEETLRRSFSRLLATTPQDYRAVAAPDVFAATRRTSSYVSNFAAVRRPGSSSQ
jgi:AraC-like DNA-binding protein